MLSILKILVFVFAIKNPISEASFKFATAKDFFKFLEKWTRSESVEDFRSVQTKFMKQLMNTSADPCENFNDYACGNFNSIEPSEYSHIYRGRTTIGISMSILEYSFIANAIKEDIGNETKIIVKLNNFYRSCMNDEAWKPEVAGEFIRNFADWPILQNETHKMKFDWIEANARANLHGSIILFFHNMMERNGTYYDSIEPVWDPVPSLEDLKNYSRVFGIDLAGKEHELSDPLLFLDEIHNLTYDYSARVEAVFHTISDLRILYPKFDILRYLQIIRGSEAVSSDTVVHIYNPVHFRKLYDLIASTDNEIVGNAIFAKVVTELPPQRTENFYKRRKQVCNKLVTDLFLVGLVVQFADNYYTERNIRENVEHLTTDIVKAAGRVYPYKNVNDIKKDIFYPLRPDFTQFFMDFYQQIDIDPHDFYSNFFKMITAYSWAIKRYPDRIRVISSYSRYSSIYGIVVPFTLLTPPFYHDYAPNYVKFGGLGSYIGHQIYRETSEDREAYKRTIECLSSHSYGYNSPCAATEGLKISVSAYKQWMSVSERNRETTGIEVNGIFLDGLQGLFLSHAQSICSENQGPKMAISRSYSNLPEFKDAFHCHETNLTKNWYKFD